MRILASRNSGYPSEPLYVLPLLGSGSNVFGFCQNNTTLGAGGLRSRLALSTNFGLIFQTTGLSPITSLGLMGQRTCKHSRVKPCARHRLQNGIGGSPFGGQHRIRAPVGDHTTYFGPSRRRFNLNPNSTQAGLSTLFHFGPPAPGTLPGKP